MSSLICVQLACASPAPGRSASKKAGREEPSELINHTTVQVTWHLGAQARGPALLWALNSGVPRIRNRQPSRSKDLVTCLPWLEFPRQSPPLTEMHPRGGGRSSEPTSTCIQRGTGSEEATFSGRSPVGAPLYLCWKTVGSLLRTHYLGQTLLDSDSFFTTYMSDFSQIFTL